MGADIDIDRDGMRGVVLKDIDMADLNLGRAISGIDGIQGVQGIGKPAELSSISGSISNIRKSLSGIVGDILDIVNNMDKAEGEGEEAAAELETKTPEGIEDDPKGPGNNEPHGDGNGDSGHNLNPGGSNDQNDQVNPGTDSPINPNITEDNLEAVVTQASKLLKDFFNSHPEFGWKETDVDKALDNVKLATTRAEWELLCQKYGLDPNKTYGFNLNWGSEIWLSPSATLETLIHERTS